jgi:hypothetical protein
MPNKKINQLDTRTGAALTDLILIGDPTSGTSFKLTATDFRTLLNNVPYTGATTNVNLGAFNLTAASIIKSGGTSSQFLKADGSVDSSTYTPTSRTLTINGTSFDLSADRAWTIAAGITGTGVAGQVAYWNGTSSQTGSNNLFWDAANARLGIGTNTPVSSIDILINNSSPAYNSLNVKNSNANGKSSANFFNNNNEGGSFATYGTTFGAITFRNNFAVSGTKSVIFLTDGNLATGGTSPILFIIGGYDNTPQMTLNGSGRLLLGTTTDSGQRLQVQGDAFIRGSGATSGTIALTVQNSSSNSLLTLSNAGEFQLFGSNNLLIQPTDTNPTSVVYSGRNTVFYNYTTNQAATIGSFIFNGANFTHQSANSIVFNILKGIAPTGGTGTFSLFSISSTINQTGGANGITRGLYVNPTLTAAADWRSIEWSNNSGWGLYGAGTANNYLGGDLTFASSKGVYFASSALGFFGDAGIGSLTFRTNSTSRLTIDNGGNINALNSPTAAFSNIFITGSNIEFRNGIHFFSWENNGSRFQIKNITNANTIPFAIFAGTNNISVGSTTDAGFKLDVNGTARVQSKLSLSAGTTSNAQINLASSTAPTSPNNGDIWFDGTDLKMRIGGVTKTFTLV